MGKFANIFIVSDIDHTFLADDRSVPQKNIDALKYFKSEGGQFTFATGRSHHSLLQAFPNAKELLNAPAILGNGSYLFDYVENKLIYPMYLEKELAVKVAKFILDKCPDTGMRILTSETVLYSLVNSYIESEISLAWYQNISEYQAPEAWTGENWCKIVVRDDPEKLDKLREELSKAKKKREDADRKVKQIENKLREAENTQIISDVTALNLTPEQLAEFLKMITTKDMHPTVQSYEEVENLQLEEKESEDEEDEM